MSLYKVLGVSKSADDKEIREAYKAEVVKAHPDKGGTPHRFAQLQQAYETLKDKAKRRDYDEELEQLRKAKSFRRPPPLQHVKAPASFLFPDGQPYIFETAPDRLRCKFRNGDIVCWNGCTGCFIGLGAHETLYWVRTGTQFATVLFSLGMGDDRNCAVVLRASPNTPLSRKTSSMSSTFSASTTSNSNASPSSPPQNSRRFEAAEDERVRKLKAEIMNNDKLRLLNERISKMQVDEDTRRKLLVERVLQSFEENRSIFYEGLRKMGWKPKVREARGSVTPDVLLRTRSPVREYINSSRPRSMSTSGVAQQRRASSQTRAAPSPCPGSLSSSRAAFGSSATLNRPSPMESAAAPARARSPASASTAARVASTSPAPPPVRRSTTPTAPQRCKSPTPTPTKVFSSASLKRTPSHLDPSLVDNNNGTRFARMPSATRFGSLGLRSMAVNSPVRNSFSSSVAPSKPQAVGPSTPPRAGSTTPSHSAPSPVRLDAAPVIRFRKSVGEAHVVASRTQQ